MPVAQYQTMEDLIERRVLIATSFDPSATMNEIHHDLQVVCEGVGAVVVTRDLSRAYCNFERRSEAKEALERHRFSTKVAGKLVSLTYSAGPNRGKIHGPWGHRLTAFVGNLSPEVDKKLLFQKFEKYGEIYRLRVDFDERGARYGLVQYIDEKSTMKAVKSANNTPWYSTILQVKRHDRMIPPAGGEPTQRAVVVDHSNSSTMWPSSANHQTPPRLHPLPTRTSDGSDQLSSPRSPGAWRKPPSAGAWGKPPTWSKPLSPRAWGKPQPGAIPTASSSLHPSQEHGVTSSKEDLARFDSNPNCSYAGVATGVQEGLPASVEEQEEEPEGSFTSADNVETEGLPAWVKKVETEGSPALAENLETEGSPSFAENLESEGSPPLVDEVETEGSTILVKKVETEATQNASKAAGVPRMGGERSAVSGAPAPMSLMDAVHSLSKTATALVEPLGKLLGTSSGDGLLSCPLTHEVYIEPVVAADGHTYERAAIKEWLEMHGTSPLTRNPLPEILVPNLLIGKIIKELNIGQGSPAE